MLTHHQFGEACMQLLGRRHGGAELQQLQRHAVLQVDLRGLAATKAAQEAQPRPRPLPGGHGDGGDTGVTVTLDQDGKGTGQGTGKGSEEEGKAAI